MTKPLTFTQRVKYGYRSVYLDRKNRLGSVLAYNDAHVMRGAAFHYLSVTTPASKDDWNRIIEHSRQHSFLNVSLYETPDHQHLEFGQQPLRKLPQVFLPISMYLRVLQNFAVNFAYGPTASSKFRLPTPGIKQAFAKTYPVAAKLRTSIDGHYVFIVDPGHGLAEKVRYSVKGVPADCKLYRIPKYTRPISSKAQLFQVGLRNFKEDPQENTSFNLSGTPKWPDIKIGDQGDHVFGQYIFFNELIPAILALQAGFLPYVTHPKALIISAKMDQLERTEADIAKDVEYDRQELKRLESKRHYHKI